MSVDKTELNKLKNKKYTVGGWHGKPDDTFNTIDYKQAFKLIRNRVYDYEKGYDNIVDCIKLVNEVIAIVSAKEEIEEEYDRVMK